jgi:hypothetical protein
MGYLDSVSATVNAILTRKGREILAKNDGTFRITKFAFGDDEVNYQLYNPNTGDDTDILNLPILEPSSNENAALRYRLVTLPKGTIVQGFLIAMPSAVTLQNASVPNATQPNATAITVRTVMGMDLSGYSVNSRDPRIAFIPSTHVASTLTDDGLNTFATIQIKSGNIDGVTLVDVVGRDTGASCVIAVVVTSNVNNA